MRKRKDFSPEFEREAVRLLDTGEKPAADLARELGVRRNQLYKWKEELTKHGGIVADEMNAIGWRNMLADNEETEPSGLKTLS